MKAIRGKATSMLASVYQTWTMCHGYHTPIVLTTPYNSFLSADVRGIVTIILSRSWTLFLRTMGRGSITWTPRTVPQQRHFPMLHDRASRSVLLWKLTYSSQDARLAAIQTEARVSAEDRVRSSRGHFRRGDPERVLRGSQPYVSTGCWRSPPSLWSNYR